MYYLLYGVVKAISLLPFCLLYRLSDILYLIVYYLVAYRKDIVRENLRYSFPSKSLPERKKIEKEFYHHFCDLLFESIKLLSVSEKTMQKRMKYIDYEPLLKHYDEGKCVLLQTSHYCNWEWTSTFSTLLPTDKPVYQIYKQQSSAISDRIIGKIRRKFGAENVEMRSVLRTMIEMKKQGKQGMYGMISDQSPAKISMHYYTQFLHQRTAVITGTEQLSKKFDYPIYYVRTKKIKRGYYTCQLIPLSLQPKITENFDVSERYMRLLESDIQSAPAHWLWTHKRWKYTRK